MTNYQHTFFVLMCMLGSASPYTVSVGAYPQQVASHATFYSQANGTAKKTASALFGWYHIDTTSPEATLSDCSELLSSLISQDQKCLAKATRRSFLNTHALSQHNAQARAKIAEELAPLGFDAHCGGVSVRIAHDTVFVKAATDKPYTAFLIRDSGILMLPTLHGPVYSTQRIPTSVNVYEHALSDGDSAICVVAQELNEEEVAGLVQSVDHLLKNSVRPSVIARQMSTRLGEKGLPAIVGLIHS